MANLITLKKGLISSLAVFFILFTSFPALAVGPEGPTGPQGPTGPSGPTGPQGPTGREATLATEAATTQTSSNTNTGSDSANTNTTDTSNTTDVTSTNNADMENDVTVTANSGDNEVNRNTQVGNVTTGDIDGTVNVINMGNSVVGDGSSIGSQTISNGEGDLTLNASTDRASLTNTNTGSDSLNTNTLNNNNIVAIFDDNDARATNGIVIDANTGNNILAENTNIGNITTGDINLALNMINLLNVIMPNTVLALDVWSVLSNLNGDLILPEMANSNIGSDSTNTNTVDQNNATTVTSRNTANLDNSMTVDTNTGNNTIARNTTTGNISTGDTTIEGALTNIANAAATPVLYIVNVFGDWVGSLLGLGDNVIVNQINEDTGSGSTNENAVTHNNDTTITQENNATATNRVNVRANTGGNTVRDNTSVGNITTGSVNVMANAVNVLNTMSSSLERLNIGIINIFGNWRGNARKQQTETATNQSDASGGATETNATTTTTTTSTESIVQAPLTHFAQKVKTTLPGKSKAALQASSDSSGAASDTTQTALTTTQGVIDAASDSVLVKAFSTNAPVAKRFPQQLLYFVLAGAGLAFLWGITEWLSIRQKQKA